ncbi:hypothetical protein [Phenylobacterium sp. J367]|uniref:hypothetical protein n=1 Tax=Phenylobacterium sp. J367 TaxID=2898435 RepID=UPI00215099B1|nr:hypothetical protein [Phenylobacterium sp. J367]MCR5880814.1 hypothetical protein [Phenylobacterium sp. J367]
MPPTSLQTFIDQVRSDWGPLTSERVAARREHLLALLRAAPSETWLGGLLSRAPASEELHRDPDFGFVLLAHAEQAGLYRPPHDHGRSSVIYAIQHGEIEMRTYGRIEDADGRVRLVQRDSRVIRAGGAEVYLPGDIHDTRCLSHSALLFRFTERDLKVEDRLEHRVTRYAEHDGDWAPASR